MALASGFNHAVAVLEDGDAYIWGKMQNPEVLRQGPVPIYYDQLGPRRVRMPAEVKFVGVSCAAFHTVLSSADGR